MHLRHRHQIQWLLLNLQKSLLLKHQLNLPNQLQKHQLNQMQKSPLKRHLQRSQQLKTLQLLNQHLLKELQEDYKMK